MIFTYTAFNPRGERLTDLLEAVDKSAAQQELMRRGLMVVNLEPRRVDQAVGQLGLAPVLGRLLGRGSGRAAAGAKPRELILMARQMAMMLRAGASLVPALTALRAQPGRPAWHALLDDLIERVESGVSLHDALARHPACFAGTFRGVVAAGEATGQMPEAFERIAGLLDARQRIRSKVSAALVYPMVLIVMALGVVTTLTTFVLPRFAKLFEMLDTPLPTITLAMLTIADYAHRWWPLVLGVPVGLVALLVTWLRSAHGRRTLGVVALHTPIIGRALAGVLLSQLLHTWAALLRSRVSVLDALDQSRETTGNILFLGLIDELQRSVSEGRPLSGVLRNTRFVPTPVVAAISVGEESGRLGESMEYVGNWLEEENALRINAITRALEPAILVMMGVVVGGVAISLFLPLFDVATAAG